MLTADAVRSYQLRMITTLFVLSLSLSFRRRREGIAGRLIIPSLRAGEGESVVRARY